MKRRKLRSFVVVTSSLMSISAFAFAPCHERETSSETVTLRSAPEGFHFYYRVESSEGLFRGTAWVIYIPPDVVIDYIAEHHGFRSSPQGLEPDDWSDLLPLERHTDIYQPLLGVIGRPNHGMAALIADSIESGDAAISNSAGDFLDTVTVASYDEGCEGGRIFTDPRGNELFRIVDGIA